MEEVSELLLDFALIASQAERAPHFHLLGTSGTVTTVGGIHLDLLRYDRRRVDGLWMNEGDVTRVVERLVDTPFAERAANPHRQGSGGPRARRLRHPGGDPPGVPIRAAADRRPGSPRRHPHEHDARGSGLAPGELPVTDKRPRGRGR